MILSKKHTATLLTCIALLAGMAHAQPPVDVKRLEQRLNKMVKQGSITRERADEILKNMKADTFPGAVPGNQLPQQVPGAPFPQNPPAPNIAEDKNLQRHGKFLMSIGVKEPKMISLLEHNGNPVIVSNLGKGKFAVSIFEDQKATEAVVTESTFDKIPEAYRAMLKESMAKSNRMIGTQVFSSMNKHKIDGHDCLLKKALDDTLHCTISKDGGTLFDGPVYKDDLSSVPAELHDIVKKLFQQVNQ